MPDQIKRGAAEVYRYENQWGDRLCIGTCATPQQNMASLGANRIVPVDLAQSEGFDLGTMAGDLATRMQEKIDRMASLGLSQRLGLGKMEKFAGGKCVALPGPLGQRGQKDYQRFLDFEIESFNDFESKTGICLITGQDLGHGPTDFAPGDSLKYLKAGFGGIVDHDTSFITAYGVFCLTWGMFEGLDVVPRKVGVIGAGQVGLQLIKLCRNQSVEVFVMEKNPERREKLLELGISPSNLFDGSDPEHFFKLDMQAFLANANCNTFDRKALAVINENQATQILSGAENLALPEREKSKRSLRDGVYYGDPEIAGLTGALCAAKIFECRQEGRLFDEKDVVEAANELRNVGFGLTAARPELRGL